MAKKQARRSRRRGLTIVKLMKAAIALTPVAMKARQDFANFGGEGAAAGFIASYTGFNFQTNAFDAKQAIVGWLPLGAAWAFGKLAGRVLRL